MTSALVVQLLREESESLFTHEERELLSNFTGDDFTDVLVFPYGNSEKCVHLETLRVLRGAPPGSGTAQMRKLCSLADKHGWIITLSLGGRGDGGGDWKKTTSRNRLIKFYRRFGFAFNSQAGRYDLRGSMFRLPNA